MPNISIIVPVYNTEKYLERCLVSLVSQTLQSIEIIIIDDGSTDDSSLIIHSFQKQYPDKIISFYQSNRGLSAARNKGIEVAKGSYLGFVDSDDFVDKEMFNMLLSKAEKTEAEIVCCPFIEFFEGSQKINTNFFSNEKIFGKDIITHPELLNTVHSFACNKIFNKAFWDKHGFKFPESQIFEDSALIYKVLLFAKKIECVNSPFYFYLKSRGGALTQISDLKIYDIFKSCESILSTFKEHEHWQILKDQIIQICLKHLRSRFRVLNFKQNFKLSNDYINSTFQFMNAQIPDWKDSKFLKPSIFKFRQFLRAEIMKSVFLSKLWVFYFSTRSQFKSLKY